MWYIICDNCETGDSGKVAHSSESGEYSDIRGYGDSDKTCDSGESDISSEYGESGELSESCEFCDIRINEYPQEPPPWKVLLGGPFWGGGSWGPSGIRKSHPTYYVSFVLP